MSSKSYFDFVTETWKERGSESSQKKEKKEREHKQTRTGKKHDRKRNRELEAEKQDRKKRRKERQDKRYISSNKTEANQSSITWNDISNEWKERQVIPEKIIQTVDHILEVTNPKVETVIQITFWKRIINRILGRA